MDISNMLSRAIAKVRRPLDRALDSFAIRRFHQIVYYRRVWATTHWMGRRLYQYPSDLIVKQELIARVRPDLLIECGTAHGGSALFYAHLLDIIGKGRVLTIDIAPDPERPRHPRIEYLTAPSTAAETVAKVHDAAAEAKAVMVVLDSLHACAHVAAELDAYHGLVTPGSYLIVEDGEMNGHPVYTRFAPDQGAGPYEATMAFLARHPEFEPDRDCERYLVTGHPSGYLRRK